MPMRYPKDFHRAVCARLVAGEGVSSLSKEVGIRRERFTCGSARLSSTPVSGGAYSVLEE